MFRTATNRTRKYRKASRTIPIRGNAIRGDGEDNGKYYRCWNCGFICNVERDELGDSQSVAGLSYEIYEQKYSTDPYPSAQGEYVHGSAEQAALINTIQLGKGHIALENGMDGNPKSIMQNWGPVVTSGCPFCGCRNWRGDN